LKHDFTAINHNNAIGFAVGSGARFSMGFGVGLMTRLTRSLFDHIAFHAGALRP
jgi:hypothetical protein